MVDAAVADLVEVDAARRRELSECIMRQRGRAERDPVAQLAVATLGLTAFLAIGLDDGRPALPDIFATGPGLVLALSWKWVVLLLMASAAGALLWARRTVWSPCRCPRCRRRLGAAMTDLHFPRAHLVGERVVARRGPLLRRRHPGGEPGGRPVDGR